MSGGTGKVPVYDMDQSALSRIWRASKTKSFHDRARPGIGAMSLSGRIADLHHQGPDGKGTPSGPPARDSREETTF